MQGAFVIIDGASETVMATIPQTPGLYYSAVDEATNTVYSTNSAESTVMVFDGATNSVAGYVPVGEPDKPAGCYHGNTDTCTTYGANSNGLAYGPTNGKLYVANYSGGTNQAGNLVILSTGVPSTTTSTTSTTSTTVTPVNVAATPVVAAPAFTG